ncbi:histidine phosphatase family protein [Nocardioides marinquilinus]|uniref:Histidine phosphatase family protein n=1 Tax=Nocardioides marinquilinus TaxID=1210400 RepID=A0ABP9PUJ9_9ACTN
MSQTSARTLVVVRHAKAEAGGGDDAARELTPGGRDDAAEAGSWLAGRGVVPDHALVSAAVRTDQTWQHLCRGAGWTLDAELDRGLYAADADTALDLVRGLGDDVATAVVVGHNPTMGYLAQLLDDGDGDPAPSGELAARGFPTGAAAVFEVDGAWADLALGGARLTGFHVGRASAS